MGKTDKIKHKKVKGERLMYKSISLLPPVAEDLAILRECYEDTWFPLKGEDVPKKRRQAVSYEKVFERLLSKSGLGHVDPDVYKVFMEVRKTRKEFPEVVKVATRKAVKELASRAEKNGNSLKEEALKEQETAKAELEESRKVPFISPDSPISPELSAMAGTQHLPSEGQLREDPRIQAAFGVKTEKRFVHTDGRWFRAEMGSTTWVPVNPDTGKWMKVQPVLDEGFILKDVEI